MKFKKGILFVAIALFSLAACSKKSTPNPTASKTTAVYITGNVVRTGNLPTATYWRNGVQVALADSTGNTTSTATGIAVNDTDVYVAGAVNGFATYWKNGKAVTLSTSFSYANAIAVSGTDVYVAGYIAPSTPVYWKNGVQVTLDAGGAAAYADAIAVSGNEVYVAGNSYAGGNQQDISYWNNGVLTSIATSPKRIRNFLCKYLLPWLGRHCC